MKIIGKTTSIAEGNNSPVFHLEKGKDYQIIRCYPSGEAVTFSMYAKTTDNMGTLVVKIESPFSRQTKEIEVIDNWERHIISLFSECSLQPLDVYIKSKYEEIELSIAFPQVEEGLYATSPILPELSLPAIASGPSSSGPRRESDRMWIDKEKSGVEIDSNSATITCLAEPTPKTSQLLKSDFLPFISLWSKEKNLEYSAGISGYSNGLFVLRERYFDGENIIEESFESDLIGGKQKYLLCLSFDRGICSLIVNGKILLLFQVDALIKFDRIYIGCSHFNSIESLSGGLHNFLLFPTPLTYPRILQLYSSMLPEAGQYTYEYMMKYFTFALTDENEEYSFKSCLEQNGFNYLISQLNFTIPCLFDQFPTSLGFKEEDIRDYAYALMKRPGGSIQREGYSKIGRSDLLLEYKEQDSIEKYHIEFKIWGRKGYNEVPSQPLKYMSDSERAGVIIMIDRSKRTKYEQFKEIVSNCVDYPCYSIKEIPLLDTDVYYFLSFHKDDRYRGLRLMICIYLPIPE